MSAAEIVPPELSRRCTSRRKGNPLFVGELVRLLAVEGVLSSQAAAAARLAIPATVRDVIARRRAHLSEECNTRHPNP